MKPIFLALIFLALLSPLAGEEIVTVASGNWSDPQIWVGGKLPPAGSDVLIDSGHVIIYDQQSDTPIRTLHLRGQLRFSTTRNTLLDVGLVMITSNRSPNPNLDCSIVQTGPVWPAEAMPALIVGTMDQPVSREVTARIRLTWFPDLNPDCAPGIINFGGRMDFHGAPMKHTWLKLGKTARAGDQEVVLSADVDWRVGDEIIVTTTVPPRANFGNEGSYRTNGLAKTEERTIRSLRRDASGRTVLSLDHALDYDHHATKEYCGEVAVLSRNVIVQSKEPNGQRGHTMYHYGSKGSISYAEFAHLGKENVLARYPIHFHLLRDSNRGSSVIGASIRDSHNRFLTIHSTDYLVVRDCVGYQSRGHGFFMEDASEVYNLLENNLSVQAYTAKPLPNQALSFDENEGAGFWWANGRNAFVNNVAAECDQYGFRFQIPNDFHSRITMPDGSAEYIAVAGLPFIRFEDNEVHSTLLYGARLNGKATPADPFVIEGLHIWDCWYAFTPDGDNTYMKNISVRNVAYGFYGTETKNVRVEGFKAKSPGNFAIGLRSRPEGLITFEDVEVDSCPKYPFRFFGNKQRDLPADIHVRNYKLTNIKEDRKGADGDNTARPKPDITLTLHDFYGPDLDAKAIPVSQSRADGLTYAEYRDFASDIKVAKTDVPWPDNPIKPRDTLPPATVITYPAAQTLFDAGQSEITVSGTCIDASDISQIRVNGIPAKPVDGSYLQWSVTLSGLTEGLHSIEAKATDVHGNVEITAHHIQVSIGEVAGKEAPMGAIVPSGS